MSWTNRVLDARAYMKPKRKPTEEAMPDVTKDKSFPKHPALHLDSDNRLCLTLPKGDVIPLTKAIVFTNNAWATEAFERLTTVSLLQGSLASVLLCVRKLMHSKTKKGALNDADLQILTIALENLRNSRGNEMARSTSNGQHYGMSFIDAIDKTFKAEAEASAASAG